LSNTNDRPFVGLAMVYGVPIYVDTVGGIGVGRVLEMMSKFLEGFSNWRRFDPAFEKIDMHQEAYAAALEGMRAYRSDFHTQLSTFLHRHVRNRMIDIGRRGFLLRQEADITDIACGVGIGIEEGIDLAREIGNLDERWGRIMRKIFVDGEKIGEVAHSENMSPWGLTRVLRKRLVEARHHLMR